MRDAIKSFIQSRLWEGDLEWGRDFEEDRCEEYKEWNFTDMQHFYEHNFKIINSMNDDQIKKMIDFIMLSKELNLHLMDKESFVGFPFSGFCFNAKGDFVAFNER